ncbi:hypothetical protein IIV31_020L [Armadillidium vulgare iridescent virus]|uniref:Uncharacterized protein n=1 Tax=Armadillidium vulgare iridescent virus TaxID=72201 RepID=A0A068QK35_9VIRU|nr:hypothetical protein IIV31_020L [Armadillidium vulgare iridescent virus]CCV02392.1 hypothetical protein IIV31_020L [Armadillidium vulgare iridescent virus]
MIGKTPIETILGTWRTRGPPAPGLPRESQEKAPVPLSRTNVLTRRLEQTTDYLCPNVLLHQESCPVCSNLRTKEKMIYIVAGVIISFIILFGLKIIKH